MGVEVIRKGECEMVVRVECEEVRISDEVYWEFFNKVGRIMGLADAYEVEGSGMNVEIKLEVCDEEAKQEIEEIAEELADLV